MGIKKMLLPARVVILLVMLQINLATIKTEAGSIKVGNVESAEEEKISLQEENNLLKQKLKILEEESAKKLAEETKKCRAQLIEQKKKCNQTMDSDVEKTDQSGKLQNLKEHYEKNMTICFNQLSNCRLENNIQTKNSNCTDSISFKQVNAKLLNCTELSKSISRILRTG